MFKRFFKRGRTLPVAGDGPLDLVAPDSIARFREISLSERAHQSACPLTSGGVLLLDPEDVRAAFTQKAYSNAPSRFSALSPKNRNRYVAADVAGNIPPFLDAPRHTVIRKWLSKAIFATLKEFEDTIPYAANVYVADLPKDRDLLLVEDVARGFATETIMRFVGVDAATEEIKTYTKALFKLFAPIPDVATLAQTNAALAEARVFLRKHVAARRADRKPCLISALLGQQEMLEPEDQDPEVLDILVCDNALLVLADGVENVETAIADVVMQSLVDPRPQEAEIDSAFVRAVLHANTPGQTIARIAGKEMHIAGETCAAGMPVFLSLASANARSTDGTDYSFGMGRHRCLGEGLAIETIVACSRALSRRSPVIDTRNQFFEQVFGHRWTRGVMVRLGA